MDWFFKKIKELSKTKHGWWAHQDSNLGPIHYECTATTNEPLKIYQKKSKTIQQLEFSEYLCEYTNSEN